MNRLFRKNLQLPLTNPDIVSLLLQILSREGLMGVGFVYDTVKQIIDDAFDGGSCNGTNVLDDVIPALVIYRPSPVVTVVQSSGASTASNAATATASVMTSTRASFISLPSSKEAIAVNVTSDSSAVASAVNVSGYGSEYERIFYMMNR